MQFRSGIDSSKSIRTYLMVGAALFVFTGITVAVNQIHLAVPAGDHASR